MAEAVQVDSNLDPPSRAKPVSGSNPTSQRRAIPGAVPRGGACGWRSFRSRKRWALG